MRGGFFMNNELTHWGIHGMKWGIRRYQNEDGSLTPEGKRRYAENYDAETGMMKNLSNPINREINRRVEEEGKRVLFASKSYEDLRTAEHEYQKAVNESDIMSNTVNEKYSELQSRASEYDRAANEWLSSYLGIDNYSILSSKGR